MGTGSFSSTKTPAVGFSFSYPGRTHSEEVLAGEAAELTEMGTFGSGTSQNRLYAGDNLKILRSLCEDDNIKGKARLVYIDPPYATGFAFESATVGAAYLDHIRGADYIESLRQRVIVLRELMADDGTIYLHLDSTMVFHAKILMDEIFGAANFRSFISRIKCNPKNQARRQFGDVCDYILFYSKGKNYVWNQPIELWEEEAGLKEYGCIEESTGRRFKKVPCHLPGIRYGETGTMWRGKLPPPGKHWVHSPAKLDEMDARGEIYWSKTGNPRRKLYLDEAAGKRRSNLWTDFRDTQNQNAKITGYPTEKNLSMMEMIIEASSNPGDLVIDAYAGSGTTLAAASLRDRAWIGIDESPVAIETSIQRLVLGTPKMGSHARNDYVVRHAHDEAEHDAPSFSVIVDSKNKALKQSITRLTRRAQLAASFNPVGG